MSGLDGGGRAGGSSSRSGNVSLGLSLAAIVVAIAAVGFGWAVPGPSGAPGIPGSEGGTGPAGSNGVNCWDLNGNGIADPATEDRNRDSLVNVVQDRLVISHGSILTARR